MRQLASPAYFDCHFPEGNARFQKVSVPKPKSQLVIVGFLTGPALPITTTCSVKRIPIEIGELQYLASVTMSALSSSHSKGASFLPCDLSRYLTMLF